MILIDLFLGFLRVGCFAFGGAYGAIPLIRDVVLSYGWLTVTISFSVGSGIGPLIFAPDFFIVSTILEEA